ncbi:MAG: signal peptidase II [bacterium]|nr:signal peptidase II [bacterium]
MKKVCFISLIVLLLDRVTKFIIVKEIDYNTNIIIIRDFLEITYVKNDGAAFSILSGSRVFLIFCGIIALILIFSYIRRSVIKDKYELIGYGLIIGGTIGNLLDRIVYGYVIDFISFKIFGYNAPVFNVGDIAITVGVLIMIGGIWFSKRNKTIHNV